MTNSKRKKAQEESSDIKLRRYNVQYIVYAPDIAVATAMVRDGVCVPVQIILDEQVTNDNAIGY